MVLLEVPPTAAFEDHRILERRMDVGMLDGAEAVAADDMGPGGHRHLHSFGTPRMENGRLSCREMGVVAANWCMAHQFFVLSRCRMWHMVMHENLTAAPSMTSLMIGSKVPAFQGKPHENGSDGIDLQEASSDTAGRSGHCYCALDTGCRSHRWVKQDCLMMQTVVLGTGTMASDRKIRVRSTKADNEKKAGNDWKRDFEDVHDEVNRY